MIRDLIKPVVLLTAGMLLSAPALAAPVNGTGLVTPDVIFGSGNANGSFTGVNTNNVELGLRGKVRYNSAGLPENTFNYDGDRTYTFSPADSNAPANRSAFNFEWSINSDVSGTGSRNLTDLTYLLQVDTDPGAGTNFESFDPINQLFADHALGNNSTANGAGVSNLLLYSAIVGNYNVAQNSWNLGFSLLFPGIVDPQAEGLYTINLSAALNGNTLASTSIDILYGVTPVPVPAALPLLAAGLGLLGYMGTRRRRQM
ncbi:PEP-CTERM sorting domain-containing protein [Roseibium sp. MMSF_3412]|uniref:PEP-CTERM sorting domain-containing protein n=1 Tax=Roseibium sp. MMSF_3412 TaxID=3046712 RepID=UPI002740107D|nr:PEP-CTERM sorting domain-containing protein [Roseibium sp. MMSF_3412]